MWNTNFLHVATNKRSLQSRIISISDRRFYVSQDPSSISALTSSDRENLLIETHLYI